MGTNSKIEWCDHTFNPWIGCQKVSPGCDNCYAEHFCNTLGKGMGVEWGAGKPRLRTSPSTWKQPLRWNRQAGIKFLAWDKFKMEYPGLTDEQLEAQGFIKPRRPRVFCGSLLCDVFDNAVPDEWRVALFQFIRATLNLDWLLLTKRIGNANNMIQAARVNAAPLTNVWLGITICNQEEADRDIPKLLEIPAAKRFLSIEPMLGPVDLKNLAFWTDENDNIVMTDGRDPDVFPDIHWVIVGGETGAKARPLHPAWVQSIRDQCQEAGVPFFFKQWGEFLDVKHPDCPSGPPFKDWLWADGKAYSPYAGGDKTRGGMPLFRRIGKTRAGRLLDGREWLEVPHG